MGRHPLRWSFAPAWAGLVPPAAGLFGRGGPRPLLRRVWAGRRRPRAVPDWQPRLSHSVRAGRPPA